MQPHGTVAFADLPALADVSTGWMFNISDEFTTTADFKEGAGNTVPAGANIYKTSDGKWDVLAGTPVTGIKGAKETSYRRGNVNLTPVDIGAYAIEAIDEMMKKVSIPLSQELAVVGTEDDQLIVEESSGWQTVNYLEGISGSLKTIAQQLMALNSGLTKKVQIQNSSNQMILFHGAVNQTMLQIFVDSSNNLIASYRSANMGDDKWHNIKIGTFS